MTPQILTVENAIIIKDILTLAGWLDDADQLLEGYYDESGLSTYKYVHCLNDLIVACNNVLPPQRKIDLNVLDVWDDITGGFDK